METRPALTARKRFEEPTRFTANPLHFIPAEAGDAARTRCVTGTNKRYAVLLRAEGADAGGSLAKV